MKRKIIEIDENKCNGCGLCVGVCAEAALEMVDNKAKLTKDFYCDGMGACLDVCPVDALKIIEKETAEYDPEKTYEHVKGLRGEEQAKKVHGVSEAKNKTDEPMKCGCPGTMTQDFRGKETSDKKEQGSVDSELRQWPIQLRLISPLAPYFSNADLVVSADCAAFAFGNFHQKFLKGRALVIFCPKLDEGQEEYKEKLTQIFKTHNIKSISVVHMEVPCCGGVGYLIKEALKDSGKDIKIKDYTISLQGEVTEL